MIAPVKPKSDESLRRAAGLCAIVFAIASPATAQERPPEATPVEASEEPAASVRDAPPGVGLDRVVITATRSEAENFYVPYVVESLDGGSLTSELGVRTLPEALQTVPGVMVQKTGHGQGSPFIRGFTGFRTLLLIDGIRLNNAVFRDGPNQYWSTIDPLTIGRLEVVKGPSSVLYGSDAIGGTVNVLTRSYRPHAVKGDSGDSRYDWERRAYYRFASAEDSHVVRGEMSGAVHPHAGMIGGLSYRDFGDLSGGRHIGEMDRTNYDAVAGDVKTNLRLRRDLELVLAYQRMRQDDAPRTHSTIYSKSYRGTTVGSDLKRDLDQDRQLGYAQLHWTPKGWITKATTSVSYQLQSETEMRVRGDGRRRRQGFDDGTFGIWTQLESPSPIGTLNYGIEYYRDDVESFFREFNADGSPRLISPRGPVADDASYDLLGVYLQDTIEAGERLTFVLGGRFNYSHARADDVDPDPSSGPDFEHLDEDFSAVVGSFRTQYELVPDEWSLFGGVSQGFRAPNLSDLTRFDVARSGELETPSPDLDPERYIAFEIGSKYAHEDLGLHAFAAYHYTIIDGMIVRFPTGNIIDGDEEVTKDNVGDGFLHGFELGLAWNFYKGFTAFGNAAWIEGEADTFVGTEKKDEPISRLQPAMAHLGLRWDSPEKKYWAEVSTTIADNADRLSPRDERDTQRIPAEGTPGYTIYTLRGGARILDKLKLFGAVENITDRDYRVHGSGQNGPGTNVILGADWTF